MVNVPGLIDASPKEATRLPGQIHPRGRLAQLEESVWYYEDRLASDFDPGHE